MMAPNISRFPTFEVRMPLTFSMMNTAGEKSAKMPRYCLYRKCLVSPFVLNPLTFFWRARPTNEYA